MVEYDPYDPSSVPVKRTALGRFKHEGATSFVNKDGRVVLYSGDDERFDYLYRFVTSGHLRSGQPRGQPRPARRRHAVCREVRRRRKLTWLPLVHGQGPLTAGERLHSQADVLIETRRAADLLGATPMDRPEDVEPNPVNGRVYVMLTNNTRRKAEQVDAVNPRANNAHGQVVELIPPGGARRRTPTTPRTSSTGSSCCSPATRKQEGSGAKYHPGTEAWISSPDNCAFDTRGGSGSRPTRAAPRRRTTSRTACTPAT